MMKTQNNLQDISGRYIYADMGIGDDFIFLLFSSYSTSYPELNTQATRRGRTSMMRLPPSAGDETIDDPAVARQYSLSATTKPCFRTTTTRRSGVGVVIAILVFLALLVGTKWIHLDASAAVSPLPAIYIHCMRCVNPIPIPTCSKYLLIMNLISKPFRLV
jgi:hypothetical protein